MRKLAVLVLGIVGLASIAATCVIKNIALTEIGGQMVFGAEMNNGTEANIINHKYKVSFVNSAGDIVATKTVSGCLRSLQAGASDFFSANSGKSKSQAKAALARIEGPLTFGEVAVGDVVFSGIDIHRNGTSLSISGTVKNEDSTKLTEPTVCAVIYSSGDDVIVVDTDATLSDLAKNATDTFSIDLTVPDSTATVDHVDLYVDGLKSGDPIAPISKKNNDVSLGAAKVAFTTQPAASTGGVAFPTQPVVKLQNSDGSTATGSTAAVTLSITSGTGTAGAALTCTANPVNAVAGVATFAGCKIDKAGTGYTLTATSSGATSATSTAFNITVGAAAKVGFTTQPGGGVSVADWATQPVAAIQDLGGNTITGSSANVTLAIANNAGPGGTLSCTALTVAAVAGVATFAGCDIDKIGTGYTLRASSAGLTDGTSSAFNITLGAASQMIITTEPSAAAASGAVFAQQPVFRLADAGGNTITTDSASTVTLSKNVVSGGPGTLACTTNPVTPVAGVATFAGCNITTAGTYTLTATSSLGGVTTATTIVITIT